MSTTKIAPHELRWRYSNALRLHVQHDARRFEDVAHRPNLLLRHDQARNEANRRLAAREEEDAALAGEPLDPRSEVVVRKGEAEDEAAAAGRTGDEAWEEGGEDLEAGKEAG